MFSPNMSLHTYSTKKLEAKFTPDLLATITHLFVISECGLWPPYFYKVIIFLELFYCQVHQLSTI